MAEEVSKILKRVMLEANQTRTQPEPPRAASINVLPDIDFSRPARYEMDLADFPWIRFGRPQRAKTKIEPYVFTDVIRGPDGCPIERIWETYPHLKYGFPSESTQRLFIVLLDIWAEDAFLGDKINFRSLTHLYHRLGGKGACPQDRAVRIDRDLQILEHLSFNAYNAFWSPDINGYTDVKNLKLFGLGVYVHPKPVRRGQAISYQDELPFGYINVTNELRALARSKIFSTDVPISLLLKLTGQEAKLAFHLAKRFIFYPVYKRRVEDICKLIPIEAARADHRREQLRLICDGLKKSDFSLLRSWKIDKEHGEWMIEFTRARKPRQQQPSRKVRLGDLQGETRHLIDHILDAGGDEKSLSYWLMCIQALGQNTTYRAVSEANLFCRDNPGANFPKVLSSRFEAIAEEQGKVINPRRKPKLQ